MSSREQLRRFDVIGAIALASVLALALASSACALLVETDDLTDSPKTDAAASPPRTPRAPSDAGDGATSATDPNGDPGTGSTDPGGTNGGNDAAPATRDDDAGASTDGGASTDAAPKSGIACGSETCVPGASVCCYAFDAGPHRMRHELRAEPNHSSVRRHRGLHGDGSPRKLLLHHDRPRAGFPRDRRAVRRDVSRDRRHDAVLRQPRQSAHMPERHVLPVEHAQRAGLSRLQVSRA